MIKDELVEQVIEFIGRHFHTTHDAKRYIHYSDFIDFIWENSEFNMIKVKSLMNSWTPLEVHNGKVYGLFCKSCPDINQIEDDATSTSDDDEELDFTDSE